MHLSFKNKEFLLLRQGKDTGDVIEEVLVLEVPCWQILLMAFRKKRLPRGHCVLQQDDDVAQRHVVPAVREGSQLRAQRRGGGRAVTGVTETGGEGPSQDPAPKRPGRRPGGSGSRSGDGGSGRGVGGRKAEH